MDKIIKALAYDKQIRIYVILATDTVQSIKDKMMASREVTAALGRLSMATVMMGSMQKMEGRLYISIDGQGLAGKLYADADSLGNVRAYAQYPQVEVPANTLGKLDVAAVVGNKGIMQVIKDIGMREKITTQTELVNGELGMDFAHYFTVSEQIPSAVGLGVLTDDEQVKVAGGFIAQVLPYTSEETIIELEKKVQELGSLLTYLKTHSIEELVQFLAGNSAEILEEVPVSYQCTCSKERFLQALSALSVDDLQTMVDEQKTEELTCHYCNTVYEIYPLELKEILERKRGVNLDGTVY